MANRLTSEASPYLLQHAENPVDWYPWGPEALEAARRENKPILVSIGYSACHWCHVMAHESFEDPETAALMNREFINVKVDREERPDVDAIYMEAVQALTGQGGWPLNMFLTPDQQPFFGGTYFPPQARHGMPSWKQILEHVARAYREQAEDVAHNANVLTEYIRKAQVAGAEASRVPDGLLPEAAASLRPQFDWTHGGLGAAPKFPQPLTLDLLLRLHKRYGDPDSLSFVLFTLEKMARGGIFDQLGGGFHRYSVDNVWLVPHFEKMLYDNALLAGVYVHAWQITKDDRFRDIAERVLDYLLRDMRSPEGAFYSAEDADSEGVEGKYYVWTPEEIEASLANDLAQLAELHYGVSPGGNFEGKTILTLAKTSQEIATEMGRDEEQIRLDLGETRRRLLESRTRRIPPGKDVKILASWNGLVIRALSEAAGAFGRDDYRDAAQGAAEFILREMRRDGALVRSYRAGPSTVAGFLEDYAFVADGLLSLYSVSEDEGHFTEAVELARQIVDRFRDPESNLFFDAEVTEGLLTRPRSIYDNPIPSGNSAAAFVFLRLAAYTRDSAWDDLALDILKSAGELVTRAPSAFACMLSAFDFHLSPVRQIAVVGADSSRAELAAAAFESYLPNAVVAAGSSLAEAVPLLQGRDMIDGRATAYVCENFACRLPVTSREALAEQLQ